MSGEAERWGGAAYERIAAAFAPIHDRVVDVLEVRPGERVQLRFERGDWLVARDSVEELWELLSTSVPPLKNWLDGLDELRREYLLVGSRR